MNILGQTSLRLLNEKSIQFAKILKKGSYEKI